MGKHSAEPKLNIGKVFIVLIIIVAIIAGAIYMLKRNNNSNNENNTNTVTETPSVQNTDEVEETLTESPEVEETTQEVDNKVENNVEDAKQQEAIDKAKEYREKDTTGTENVNYEVESVSEDGDTMTVIVRDPETTRIIMFYDVNTKTGEVTEH